MDPELRKWLTDRKLAKKTIKVLEKEDLISVDVITLLRNDDLEKLKTQHSMSVGQIIELREARDALLRGEFIHEQATGLERNSPERDDEVMQTDIVPDITVSVCITLRPVQSFIACTLYVRTFFEIPAVVL